MENKNKEKKEKGKESGQTCLVTVDKVSKSFGDKEVLREVSFCVRQGQIVTIVGPNGAGKSTLVKVLTGLILPDSGKVVKAPFLTISYLAQNYTVNDAMPMTVKRFLALSGAWTRTRMRDEAKAMQDTLDFLGVGELFGADFHTLSGGQTQRVLLARCLLRRPNLLILDEPTRSLDINGQVEFYHILGKIRDVYGCAVLIISHDLHLVMKKADEVICLNHHICCRGVPESIGENPAYKDLFPALAAKDLALYYHHHNHAHCLAEGGVVRENGALRKKGKGKKCLSRL